MVLSKLSRRKVFKYIGNSTALIFSSGFCTNLFAQKERIQQKPFIVNTVFKSLKYPKKKYENAMQFWEDHSNCNSLEKDANLLPELVLSRKRVYMKICQSINSPISKVIYTNEKFYKRHSSFLVKKYKLNIIKKGKSKIVYRSDEFIAIDRFS